VLPRAGFQSTSGLLFACALAGVIACGASESGNSSAPGAGGAWSTSTSTSRGAGGTAFVTVTGVGVGVGGACGDAQPPPGTGCDGVAGGVAFARDVAPLLASCTGEICHASPTFAGLVGVASRECCDGRSLVAPGDASTSYLVTKLAGVDLCTGGQMPLDRPALPSAAQATIVAWICEGAPND
jgi:hypothetical protein